MRRRALSRIAFVVSLSMLFGLVAVAPALASLPKIKQFSPISGPTGTSVTILGSNFTGATSVTFNGTSALYTVNSATKITAAVPSAATTGPIAVNTPGGTAISSGNFTVVPPAPSVSLSMTSGPPKTGLNVSGSNFGPHEGVDIFFDTTDLALIGTNGAGSFSGAQIKVPASAEPGTHWISAMGRQTGLFAQATFLVQADWPQFRFSNKHSGRNPTENVLSVATVTDLDFSWRVTTGGWVNSSPAVVGGVVYVGSADGRIYALDASTGGIAWFYSAAWIHASPTVAKGVVYAASFDGNVYALDASSGAFLWSYTTGSFVSSSPAVANGAVYVGSGDGTIYALDTATGTYLWSYATGANVESSPAVVNGVVYVGSGDDKIYALNASTGARLWSFTTGNDVRSSPAVTNGVVYVGSDDGNVYALNASTGSLIWSRPTGAVVYSSPSVAEGVVYVASDNGKVHALDASTGVVLWTYTTTGALTESSPAVANGVVYVGSGGSTGKVYALNASTGAYLWSYTTGDAIFSSPAVANGMVYVGSFDNNVYAFGLADSETVKRPSSADLEPDRSLRWVTR